MEGAFVGRARELDALAATIERRGGPGTAASIVVGAPGTGKSRLLAEAAARARVKHRFWMAGYEAERHAPLAAAGGLLRALGRTAVGGDLLADLLDHAPADGDSALDPLRVLEAANRSLAALPSVLIVFDDVHWADPLSVTLCHYLVRAAHEDGRALTFLAAGRPSHALSEFASSLGHVLPAASLTVLELGELQREEGIRLARTLAPSLGDAAAERIWQRAAGSPFWIQELLRSGIEELEAGRLVTARLGGASMDAGMLLALLAVAARPLALAEVAKLEGWPSDRVGQATKELVDRGIAVAAAGTVQFAHDLIRAAAESQVSDETRRALHRRLAGWLEAEAGADLQLLARALEHRMAGGLAVLDLAHRIAASPKRRLLGSQGLQLLERLADASRDAGEATLDLDEKVAALSAELGDHHRALANFSRVAEFTVEPSRRARSLLAAARAAAALRRIDLAHDLLDRARRSAESDEGLLLEIDAQRASIRLWLEARTPEGRTLGREVAARARELKRRAGGIEGLEAKQLAGVVEALRIDSESAMQLGEMDAMLVAAEELVDASRGLGEEAWLASRVTLADALEQSRRLGEMHDHARAVWDEARRRVLPSLAADAGFYLAWALMHVGRMAEAEGVALEAAELVGRIGDIPRGRHRMALLTSVMAILRGRWQEGVVELAREAEAEPNPHPRIIFHCERAKWLARIRGEASGDEVFGALTEARACADAAGCPRCLGELRLAQSEALARVGRTDEARRALAECEPDGRWIAAASIVRRRANGLIRALEGDQRGAATSLEEARAEAEFGGFVLEEMWTRVDLGVVRARLDRDAGIEVLRGVAADANRFGVVALRQLAQASLRRLGVRTWRRGVGGGALTHRERELAYLVAVGKSNPEIAQAMFLSRKTVERHVSNILAKLGARNRTELAGRVAELAAREPGIEMAGPPR
ncbi:MAG TPA: AAA family ATPase [Candidatus Eisenbacteria bacterium]|nr:AAA family ATPase [Candidatus Eisenbacteria bacterium]